MNQKLHETMKSFKRLGQRLWTDSSGFVVSGEYILLTTIIVIGIVVGVVTFRNQVVQEFGDISEAMESLDQSYTYTIVIPVSVRDENDVEIGFVSVDFDEDDPQDDPSPPMFSDPTGESNGPGAGQPPAGISFQEPTGE